MQSTNISLTSIAEKLTILQVTYKIKYFIANFKWWSAFGLPPTPSKNSLRVFLLWTFKWGFFIFKFNCHYCLSHL